MQAVRILIFPSSENEIAPSECCNGKITQILWMHHGFLNIDVAEMSSLKTSVPFVRSVNSMIFRSLRFFITLDALKSTADFGADLMETAKELWAYQRVARQAQ